MTDQELRALVREAVARHFVGASASPAPLASQVVHAAAPGIAHDPHASHAIYLTLVNVGDSCVIEPGVTCNHCGYCKSHGH